MTRQQNKPHRQRTWLQCPDALLPDCKYCRNNNCGRAES
jgi:hypothetical protein